MPKQPVRLVPTKYAGHAGVLAYQLAKATSRPLIISASGDGGYHEVVNGLVKAQTEGARPIAGLLPAGNANDHYHNLHDSDLVEDIRAGKTRQIDLLKLTATVKGKPFERYAHSYIGAGLTPKVGLELNKTKLNRFNEVWIVGRALLSLQPVSLMVRGKKHTYDSIIFSNINKMSKFLTIAKAAQHDDGMFEITIFRRRNKFGLLFALVRASTKGLRGERKASHYAFKSVRPLLMQLDGEITTIDAGSEVRITSQQKALTCIV